MALSSTSSSLGWAESPPPRWKFDVFLSFRGEDTRRGFISHLYHQLQYRQVLNTFMDDRNLEIGADISPGLFLAIQNSHLAIVVLSPNYASSTWCLNELVIIIDSMPTRILPVFYNVDPSDVRHQRNSFAQVFAKHEVKFSNDPEKVKRWREALTKVANLSGWQANNYISEYELIEIIVKRVWEKVGPTLTLSDSREKLVGIECRLGQLGSLLALEKKDVRIIGIWGMGGVGKTTLAKLVFERISHHFEVAEVLVDVRKSHGQLVNLQKQILSPVLKENVSLVWDEYKGTAFIRNCLSNKKVLLVLDDVDSCDVLEKLAGNISWFGEGSRIIITTRDERVLIENDINISFKLQRLNHSEAVMLFCQNAFRNDQPEEGFSELTECFTNYIEGLPLALKSLGRSLYNRDLETWKSAWDKLKKCPDAKVFNSLKISYDALDHMEKNIFLDVAFFHKGMEKERVIELLELCGYSGRYGIDVLIEKSLISIDQGKNVGMHALIQEMAEKIVCQETQDSSEEPGLRSRLCHRDDIFHVFTRNTGTEAIKGIRLRLPELEEADSNWNWDCFSKMLNLMFLEFDNLIISSGPKFLPNSLIIFKWNWYPCRSLPVNFRPNLLAELHMQRNELVRLWDGRQELPNLKYMDLRHSKNLLKTPDFSGIPNIEDLDLNGCEGLVEVHQSIAVLKKLKWLTLEKCRNVKSFPSKIEMDSLESLHLSYCSKIKIPEFGEGMKKLVELRIPGTATEELPASIEHLVGLEELHISESKSLQSLAIFKLQSLTVLDISRSPKLKTLVENTEEIKCLKPSIRRKLYLLLRKKSPEPLGLAWPSPSRALASLLWLNLSDCNLGQGVIPEDIGHCMPSLGKLYLDGNNFVTLPASIKYLSKLSFIDLSRCKRLQELPDLPSNSELHVWADNCDSLKKFSEPSQQQGTFDNLEFFELRTMNCSGLINKEGLNNGIFSMLRRLAAQGFSPPSLSYSASFQIVSPGGRIAEWFEQSEGNSLAVELPPDREWMGVLFCVVFANQEEPAQSLDYGDFHITGISPAEIYTLYFQNLRHVMGNHLWVFFMPRGKIQDSTSCSVRFSFHANYGPWNKRISCSNSVKSCGARLLYEQDLKNLLNTAASQQPGHMLKRPESGRL